VNESSSGLDLPYPNLGALPTGPTDAKTSLPPAMYDYAQAADRLNCSTRHLRRLVDAGRAPQPVRLGAIRRFNVEVFERWLSDGCQDLRRAGSR